MSMCVETFKCRPNQRKLNNTNWTPCRDTWLVVLLSYSNLNQSFYPWLEFSVYFDHCSLFVGSSCLLKPRCVCTLSIPAKKKKTKIFFLGITYVWRYVCGCVCIYICVCVCVCVCVLSIAATPFNLELWNLGIWFLVCSSKNGFLKFLKKYFFRSYCPFSIFL